MFFRLGIFTSKGIPSVSCLAMLCRYIHRVVESLPPKVWRLLFVYHSGAEVAGTHAKRARFCLIFCFFFFLSLQPRGLVWVSYIMISWKLS